MNENKLKRATKRLYSETPLIGRWLRQRAARRLAADGSLESIHVLATSLTLSEDPTVQSIALDALKRLDDQSCIDTVCSVWAETRSKKLRQLLVENGWIARHPVEIFILTALSQNRRYLIKGLSAEVISPLLRACQDQDEAIARQAELTLTELTDEGSRKVIGDHLSWHWMQNRSSRLENLLVRGRYVATEPLSARVLTALKTRQRHLITSSTPEASAFLAEAYLDRDETISGEARLAISELQHPETRDTVIDELCARWASTRLPRLEELILAERFVPSRPVEARVLCALKTEQRSLIASLGPEVVEPLLNARADRDTAITGQANLALSELTNPLSKILVANKLCAQWAQARLPELENIIVLGRYVAAEPIEVRVLSALKTRQRQLIINEGPEVVSPLIAATYDRDKEIGSQAIKAITELTEPKAREVLANHLCAQWAQKRDPRLESLMLRGRYVATYPLDVKVLSALKLEQRQLLTGLGPEIIQPLLNGCEDKDDVIAQQAGQTLRQLKNVETREALCRLVIETDSEIARNAAVDGKYAPRDTHSRALFFFLTEQWERYEDLDFDKRLLLSVYESAPPPLRQRIKEKLRSSGRTDFLTIIAGGDFRKRTPLMTPEEIQFLVQMLRSNKEWAKLWELVFDLPFVWSVKVMQDLAASPWRPGSVDENKTFQDLADLSTSEMVTSQEEVSRLLPPAVRRARARVVGRINCLAFSPERPVIAFGTGNRKVGFWDFQRGEVERTLHNFGHSLGCITYLPDETLLCGERTNAQDPCSIHYYQRRSRGVIARHEGSVTGLEPVGESHVLSTGRDQLVAVWDVAEKSMVAQQHFSLLSDEWARGVCVSSKGDRAALLHKGVTMMKLPLLDLIGTRELATGVARCAAFAPQDEALILGKFNGDVLVYHESGNTLYSERSPLLRHTKTVQGIKVLHNRSIVITAGGEGQVNFISWPNRARIGNIQAPGSRLTSLHVSPGGEFMATGDSDASVSLWDLRVLDIPLLFAMPLAKAARARP